MDATGDGTVRYDPINTKVIEIMVFSSFEINSTLTLKLPVGFFGPSSVGEFFGNSELDPYWCRNADHGVQLFSSAID